MSKEWTQYEMDRSADDWMNRIFAQIDEDQEDGLNPDADAAKQHAGETLCRELAESCRLIGLFITHPQSAIPLTLLPLLQEFLLRNEERPIAPPESESTHAK